MSLVSPFWETVYKQTQQFKTRCQKPNYTFEFAKTKKQDKAQRVARPACANWFVHCVQENISGKDQCTFTILHNVRAQGGLIMSLDHGQVIQQNNAKLGQCAEKQNELETDSK